MWGYIVLAYYIFAHRAITCFVSINLYTFPGKVPPRGSNGMEINDTYKFIIR